MGIATADHETVLREIAARERAELTALSDGPGLGHLALHSGLILVLGAAILARAPGWPLLVLPQGLLLAFLFTLQHECTHKTPFKTRWLNEAVGHVTGFLIFQPFLWFRYFHLAHHRHTNDPDRDPELAGAAKPETRVALAWHLTTIGYWRDKLTVLLRNALGHTGDGFVPAPAIRKITREARLMLAGYTLAAALCLAWPGLALAWLLPLALGFPVLRLYLLAEHGRCPQVADMFRNSRTVFTNRIVRLLGWNMPYHAEHHAFPAVPFHKLPALHARVRDHLQVTAPGYRHFAGEYVRELV